MPASYSLRSIRRNQAIAASDRHDDPGDQRGHERQAAIGHDDRER